MNDDLNQPPDLVDETPAHMNDQMIIHVLPDGLNRTTFVFEAARYETVGDLVGDVVDCISRHSLNPDWKP